jgi:hypothetical protein
VLTLNGWTNRDNPRCLDILNEELQSLGPDLIALHEVIHTPAANQLKKLLRGLDRHSTHQAISSGLQPISGHVSGNAPANLLESPRRIVISGHSVRNGIATGAPTQQMM